MVIDILIGVLLILLLLKITPIKHWTVQWPGYLLRQITISLVALLVARLIFNYGLSWTLFDYGITLTTSMIVIICGVILFPYTRFGKRSVRHVHTDGNELTMVISNLQYDNGQYDKAISAFNAENADIIIVLEMTESWKEHLVSGLEGFSFNYLIAREDPWGMGVFSKYPIGSHQIYHIYNSTPTLRCRLDYKGTECELWVLHPKPPAPGEVDADTSEPLDYEFEKVSTLIDGNAIPTIVAGDLNEVAWSRTTSRFLKRSNLFDLRRGRGFLATFPSYAPWMGFPLDQIFVSHHFSASEFSKLGHIGSDHYPLKTGLVFEDPNFS